MRILFLSQLIPYPVDAGPKVRIYHVLQYLASAGHEITLVAFCRPEDKAEDIEHMRRYCREVHTVQIPRSWWRNGWQLVRSLVLNRPFLITRDEVPAMRQLVKSLVKGNGYDAVHADQLWMAQYALLAKAAVSQTQPLRTILDQHNAVFLIPQRLAAENPSLLARTLLNLEKRKMAAYEVNICRRFDHVVWVTDDDREALARIDGRTNDQSHATTIPICVDPEAEPSVSHLPGTKRVTFIGGLHWPPNSQGVLWFAEEVWPRVLARVPDAVFTIIGKNPPAGLSSPSFENQRIEVLGYVPDPKPYLSETAAFVVPLHAGGGMRVKILNAWRLGLPIVSTTIGAEGICYDNGRNLLIADDAPAFADSVVRLLCESTLAEQIGQAGRQTVESFYDWHKVYRAWDAVYGAVSA